MQIGATSAANRIHTVLAQGPAATRAEGTQKPAAANTVTLSEAGKAAFVAASQEAGRDYEHMTPKEMRAVAHELFRSGKIDLTQSLRLMTMGMPLGRVGSNGEFVPLSAAERASFESTPVDYVQTTKDAIRTYEQRHWDVDPQYGYQDLRHILAVLQG